QLMHALASGDLSALGTLYDRYHEDVRQFLGRALARGSDVDDVTHEVFLTLVRASASYDARPSARPFLIGIAAQLVRRRRRSLRRWADMVIAFAARLTWVVERTPEDAASTTEQLERFERVLDGLTEDKRLTFLMVEREGMPGDEVARALGIPIGTVWTRLHHA